MIVAVVLPLVRGCALVWISSTGTERFRPLAGSQLARGTLNEVTKGDSVKVQFSVPRDKNTLHQVIEEGIFPVHPWEEPVVLVSEEWETRRARKMGSPSTVPDCLSHQL
jgi:hypothetical protein